MEAFLSRRAWTLAGVAAATLLQACAGYSPKGLPEGATREQVIQSMGAPTGEYPLPQGGTKLEFARGPFGKHTYMLELDAAGRLLRWQQVLTEANFNALHMGMDQREVLEVLGRPSHRGYIGWQKLVLWSYRYETPFCQWFNVGINGSGKVADLGYTMDPMCEANDHERQSSPK